MSLDLLYQKPFTWTQVLLHCRILPVHINGEQTIHLFCQVPLPSLSYTKQHQGGQGFLKFRSCAFYFLRAELLFFLLMAFSQDQFYIQAGTEKETFSLACPLLGNCWPTIFMLDLTFCPSGKLVNIVSLHRAFRDFN